METEFKEGDLLPSLADYIEKLPEGTVVEVPAGSGKYGIVVAHEEGGKKLPKKMLIYPLTKTQAERCVADKL
jgi:hypothetical protein